MLIAQALRTINKWDHMKLQSFCIAKDTIFQTKLQNGKDFYRIHTKLANANI